MTLQRMHLGEERWEAEASPQTPVCLAGGPMYLITSIGGSVEPYGDEHLVGRMGGAWAHPLRVLHGWSLALAQQNNQIALTQAATADLYGSHITRHYAIDTLSVTWTEFVVEQRAAIAGIVTLHNHGASEWQGELVVQAEIDMRGCWFGGWEAPVPQLAINQSLLAVTGDGFGFAGRAAAVLITPEARWTATEQRGEARVALAIGPGMHRQVVLTLAVAHSGGMRNASDLAWEVASHAEAHLAEKIARYATLLGEITLNTPDPAINRAWGLARLNFAMLSAQYPDLPPYFLAGLPEYPQLFGCDNEYSAAGATAAGFGAVMRSTLAALASYAERACGRIPHEITTNGRVFHPGNTQETPQFAAACWDYARWSGDLGFLAQVYPLCVEGLEHFAATIEGRDYPHGDGVVERIGMGAHKLDSVCYLYQALVALDEAATTLGRPTDAERFRSQATQLRARFERDWWIEHEGLYADSLQLNKQPQLDGHWTVVLPIQLGLAAPERAERALGRIEREWVNQWGLVHTRGAEAHVWTLPTGLLALAAFAYDRSALGVTLLRNIAITGSHGTLGTLKELIPQGICFIQLWSAGLLVQGLTEGLLGLQPRAYAHSLTIKPNLPADWPEVTLRGLQVGGHTLDLHVSQTEIIVLHRNGPVPITIEYAHKTLSVDVGQRVVVNGS